MGIAAFQFEGKLPGMDPAIRQLMARFDRPCGPPLSSVLPPAHFCIMDQRQGDEGPTSARYNSMV